jgi:hypothetical protein
MATDEQLDRMILNDPLDEALAHADRIRGYARPTVGEHAALRLAVEVRDLQARVAELEKRHERDAEDLTMYESWAKNSPVKEVDCGCGRRLSVRIADADLNTSTGTDWAARWPDQETDHETGIDRHVSELDLTGETYARRVHAQYPRETELVARTNGPWRAVQP